MIASVDQHIVNRLKLIKKGGKSVTVYAPGAARPKGLMDGRCFIVSHYLPPQVDITKTKPYLEEATPSAQQVTVVYPKAVDENGAPVSITGPDSWTFRKLRTPHILSYQIDVVATSQTDYYALYVGLSEVLPLPYSFRINTCAIDMNESEKPVNLDELEAPLFRSAHRYRCSNVWIQRSTSWDVPGIKTIDAQILANTQ